MSTTAILLALGLAFVLGTTDAPNAAATLVGSRTASYSGAMVFSFAFHAVGALVGGSAVAATIGRLLRLPAGDLPVAIASGCAAAIVFGRVMSRLGLPTSASYGLFGGLFGASLVAGGGRAVVWGGLHGLRPTGFTGVVVGLALSPVLGLLAGMVLGAVVHGVARRLRRRSMSRVRATIWVSAGLVALSDGSNDGQKAMGLVVATLAVGGRRSAGVPVWARMAVAVLLAAGTAVGGRRIVSTVGRGFYRGAPVDGLAAQLAAAAVILGAGGLGVPVSTSNVVASGVIGVGAGRRPRHVRWATVAQVVWAWALTVPVCASLGAAVCAVIRAAR